MNLKISLSENNDVPFSSTENGCIDNNELKYRGGDHDRLVWLGSIHSDNGIDRLLEIANNMNEKILVAGDSSSEYLLEELSKNKNIEYYGVIKTEFEKSIFFSRAKACLYTRTSDKPSNLLILEAQSCGIPVVSWSNCDMLESNYSSDNVHNNLTTITTYLNSQEYLKFKNSEIESWCKSSFSTTVLLKNNIDSYESVLYEEENKSEKHMIENITNEILDGLDVSKSADMVNDLEHRLYYLEKSSKEHYRLLTHISNSENNCTFLDVGTYKGLSALALSENKTNKVYSFNLAPQLDLKMKPSNVEFIIDNILDPKYNSLILESKYVLLDTLHTGEFEQQFLNKLIDINYKGVLILDDIRLNPEMISFWNSIEHPKKDISNIGHISGTGVVFFN